MCKVRPMRRIIPLLPLLVALFAAITSPVAAAGQVADGRQPPVPFVNTRFDELNSGLGAAADRLLATPVRNIAGQNQGGSSVTPDNGTAERTAMTVPPPEQHRQAARLAQLRPIIDPILQSEGVPTQLAAVVLVESGGQPEALSPKGARGIWQLMPDTARRYGLTVSMQKDERLDIVSATRVAARYLHDLYAQFGDWKLALAAYNAGEQAVHTAIQRANSQSFAVLGQLRLLPAETRRYVPAVLGAIGTLNQFTEMQASGSETSARGAVFFALVDSELERTRGETSQSRP